MTITDLGHGCKLHTRDEWAQGAFNPVGYPESRDPHTVTEFWAHHSGGNRLGDADPAQWIRNIYQDHVLSRGYNDIAYEMLLDEHGDLWEGRALNLVSAATFGHNRFGTACCLLRAHDPEDDGVPAAVKVGFQIAYQLSSLVVGIRLYPGCHRDVYPTDCPGQDLTDWVHAGGLGVPLAVHAPLPPAAHAPAPSGWPPYQGTPIAQGSRGPRVAMWQARLNQLGGNRLAVDGIFGGQTKTATIAFQASRHLALDGVVGPATWAAAEH